MLAESGATTLMVTHDPEEAMFLADRIVVLDRGRVAQDASPVEIYTAPANPFVARLFGPVNELEGVARGGTVETVLGPVPAPGVEDGREGPSASCVPTVSRPPPPRRTAGEGTCVRGSSRRGRSDRRAGCC